jgi:hypothetical protein
LNYVEVNKYEERYICSHDLNRFISIIWSPMNTGKTTRTIETIIELLRKNKNESILFMINRINFAKSIQAEFKSYGEKLIPEFGYNPLIFTLYNEAGVTFKENSMIIQCESLHKLTRKYDIVIFDEITSIILQFDSKLHKENLTINHEVFFNLVSMNKNTIAMDGYINRNCIELFRYLLHDKLGYKDDKLYLNINTYKPNKRKYISCANTTQWFIKLYQYLKEGKKIYCSMGSLNESLIFEQMIKILLSDVKIQIYNSDTDDMLNTNVNDLWNQCQLLIYTLVIQNGINFDVNHFDYCFTYGNSMSNTVRNSMQIIMQVRNISSNQVYYYNKTRIDNFPIHINTILREINENIKYQNDFAKFINCCGNNSIQIMNDNKKELNLRNIWVKLMIYQQIEINTSRNSYDEMFKSYINNFGGIISVETLSINENKLDWYNCLRVESKNILKLETGERISKIKYNELFIKHCEKNILNNCAIRDEKEAILKHSVDIKVKPDVEVNPLIYGVYKDHKYHFDNIETELKQDVLNLITHDNLLDSIDSKQSKTIKVFQIQLIHGILGTKNSMDCSTIITEEKFMNIVNSYN